MNAQFLWLLIILLFSLTHIVELDRQERNKLHVFIGEKISVNKVDNRPTYDTIIGLDGKEAILENMPFDQKYMAKYLVLDNVYNDLKTDTLEFLVYDHYGRPTFEKHRYVLLYVFWNQSKKKFYHEKYLFDKVRKSNNEWRGLNGLTPLELFNQKKNTVLKNKGYFKE